jgi:adenylate cyclase
MSSDPEQSYFSDGMTQDLITDLSGLAGLSVIAGQSTFAYKGKPADAKEVSRALGADLIVNGSVRKSGDRLRVNAQLIHGQTGTHIWAERFDRDVQDFFELQDSINQKMVDALRAQLSTIRQTQQRRRGSSELEAHDYLLRGMSEFQKRTREGSARARYCFETALTLDPGYSDAYARLCFSAVYDWIAGWNNDFGATVERGLAYAQRACELDSDNAFAYAALCWARLWRGEHDLAAAAGEKALVFDPNNVAALEYRALALAWGGSPEPGLKCIAKAQFLNPLHGYQFPLAVCNFMLGKYAVAAEAAQHSVNASPRFMPAHLYLAASLQLLDRRSELEPVIARIRELDPNYEPAQTRPSTFKKPADRARFVNALEAAMRGTPFE